MNFMKAIVAAGLVAASTSAFAADITGAGSTFIFPVLSKWADAYKKESGSGVNYQSIGSGAGIKQIQAKTVTFGATDAPLKPEQLEKDGLVQWPMVMGAIVPVVNIEGIKPGELVFDGETLAKIYLGTIAKWDDPAIAQKLLRERTRLRGCPGCTPRSAPPVGRCCWRCQRPMPPKCRRPTQSSCMTSASRSSRCRIRKTCSTCWR